MPILNSEEEKLFDEKFHVLKYEQDGEFHDGFSVWIRTWN